MELNRKQLEILATKLDENIDNISLRKIDGGFTGSRKYLLKIKDLKLFLKVSSLKDDPAHAVNSLREVENYKIINELSLASFPKMVTFFESEDQLHLVIDYIDGEFGAINNETRLRNMLESLKKLSSVELDNETRFKLKAFSAYSDQAAISMQKKEKHKKIYVKNNKLFNGKDELIGNCNLTIKDLASAGPKPGYQDFEQGSLCFVDTNFGNVALTSEGGIRLVDPVYLTIGDPHIDFAVVIIDYFMDANFNEKLLDSLNSEFFGGKAVKSLSFYLGTFSQWSGEGDTAWNKLMLNRARSCLKLINYLMP